MTSRPDERLSCQQVHALTRQAIIMKVTTAQIITVTILPNN